MKTSAIMAFLAGFICLALGQQTCPDKMEQMMRCFTRLSTSSDFNSILDKKMNTARTCGATDKNIQCWKAMYKCSSDAETATQSSSQYQNAKQAAIQCYNNNPNNPLAGLEILFEGMGMHHGGKGKGGKGGKGPGGQMGGGGQMGNGRQMGTPMPGMGSNQPMEEDSSEEMMDKEEMPADCKPNDWKNLMNCTMQTLQRDQSIITAAGRLRPQLKQCEDMVTSDCEPESKPLHQCLWKALDPLFKQIETNFNTCMRTSGFPM